MALAFTRSSFNSCSDTPTPFPLPSDQSFKISSSSSQDNDIAQLLPSWGIDISQVKDFPLSRIVKVVESSRPFLPEDEQLFFSSYNDPTISQSRELLRRFLTTVSNTSLVFFFTKAEDFNTLKRFVSTPDSIANQAQIVRSWLAHEENTSAITKFTLRKANSDLIRIIPPEIEKLRSLHSFVACCPHVRDLPPQLKNLTNLEFLYFMSNDLQSFPRGMSQLKKLSRITLSAKESTEIPTNLWECSQIKALALLYPQLSKLPPYLRKLVNLQELQISSRLPINKPDIKKLIPSLTDIYVSP